MTREHILVLGLDEIQGIRLQCDLCKGAISFRLNETINIPQKCPGCGAHFVEASSFSEYEAMMALVNAVKAMTSQKKMKATLKLEVTDMA
jgi:transcription initiation factor IIE alpha subunit